MNSLLLKQTSRYLMPGFLLFSFFLLLRGHDLPGGGFAGGLVGAAAFILFGLANGTEELKKVFKVDTLWLIGLGLVLAIVSGTFAILIGNPYLQAIWLTVPFFEYEVKLSTPLIFDIGVYFVVVGFVMTIFLALQEED